MADFAGFPGFKAPELTPVPDVLIDEFMPDLTGGELKVLLYIVRRTYGFRKESDNISLSQMLHGIRKKDGEVLDRGTGVSKKTLLAALDSLEAKELIVSQRRRSAEKGDEPTCYGLRMAPGSKTAHPQGEEIHHGGGNETAPAPRRKNSTTQGAALQETDHKVQGTSTAAPSAAPSRFTAGKYGRLVRH